jgi:hypothetical protein
MLEFFLTFKKFANAGAGFWSAWAFPSLFFPLSIFGKVGSPAKE